MYIFYFKISAYYSSTLMKSTLFPSIYYFILPLSIQRISFKKIRFSSLSAGQVCVKVTLFELSPYTFIKNFINLEFHDETWNRHLVNRVNVALDLVALLYLLCVLHGSLFSYMSMRAACQWKQYHSFRRVGWHYNVHLKGRKMLDLINTCANPWKLCGNGKNV